MISERHVILFTFLIIFLFVIALTVAVLFGHIIHGDSRNAGRNGTSKWSTYKDKAVATDNELCSNIGRDILVGQGGSIMDATIATLLCLGMVNPQHSGIGGGFNAVIYDRSKRDPARVFRALNARETVPSSVDVNFYEEHPSAAETGPHSILIPGEINGFYEAWKQYGKLSWKELFQPTIRLGREGWNVTEIMAASIVKAMDDIKQDPGLRELLLKSDGTPYVAGELIRNQKLADVLEKVANNGPAVFYSGAVASDIVLDLRDIGAPNITIEDLKLHEAYFSEPLKTTLPAAGIDLYTSPPPSSGILTAFTLKLIDGYNYSVSSGVRDHQSQTLLYHRLIEAWKIAFMEAEHLGDFGKSTISNWSKSMLDENYINKWRQFIRDDKALDLSSFSTQPVDDSTSGVCIMTASGSGIAATTTVGGLWGCKRRGIRTGIIFNDGMSLFSLRRSTNGSTANYIGPMKQGRSSTSSILFVDKETNQIKMMHSSAGSRRIVTSISFIASQMLWRGLSAYDATDEPRVHHQGDASGVIYDEGLSQEIMEGLRRKGHSFQPLASTRYSYLGVTQTIQVLDCPRCPDKVKLTAVSDYRKGTDAAPGGL